MGCTQDTHGAARRMHGTRAAGRPNMSLARVFSVGKTPAMTNSQRNEHSTDGVSLL
jgi:hypothetical protein